MIIKEKTGLANRNSVRSFITINIPFDLSRQISQVVKVLSKEARNFTFVPIDQMHITLQFLGDQVSKESLKQIANKLTPLIAQVDPPVIKTGQLRFGHKSQMIPTVLFLEVEQTEEMQNITKLIHYGIKGLSLHDVRREKDYKKLIYHITLGRAKHHVSRSFGRQIINIIKTATVPEFEFKPDHIYVLNSKYTIKGHKYSEFSSFAFKN